jgi:soluble lytic murein transglycosylase-like protein
VRTLRSATPLSAALLVMLALAPFRLAVAGTVTIPIRLDEPFLRRLIVAQVFTDEGERAVLWDDPQGCGDLELASPAVEAQDGRLIIRSGGDARWGAAVGDVCLLPLSWTGLVEVVEQPTLEREHPIVHFQVVDSALYQRNGRKAFVASRLWGWIKQYVHPRMESVTVDLHAPVEELRSFLPLVLPSAYAGDADATLASVTLAAARVEEDALVIDVTITSPDPPAGFVPEPEPPLDLHEIEQWDAFLTFVVKRAALESDDSPLSTELLAALIDSRYDIVEVLTLAEPGARDPVPELFRKAWARLAPILRELEGDLPGSAALRYLALVAAGDALLAIDGLGPGSGLDISADGLRRLARMVAPEDESDPLDYATVVDAELREQFGFGPPLPQLAPPPTTTTTTTIPLPSEPAEPAEPAAPTSSAEPSMPSRLLARLLEWLVSSAEAAGEPSSDIDKRLRNWAPTRDDLDEYLPIIQKVLHAAAEDALAKKPVEAPYSRIFRPLMLATAWKESCWRQYVRRGGKVVTMQSSAGAVGIMQINPRVWRGFYDPNVLRTDTAYNARAGAEILRHYLVDYALRKKEQELGGSVDALARATYSAYNGGPGHLGRYRSETAPKSLREIDAEFWRVYRTVKGGDELGVRECYGP